jgi:hypothetical protein
VVAYLPDLFTRPAPMRTDVIIDVTAHLPTVAQMLACHRSQVFEWLAYHADILQTVPDDEGEKLAWVQSWAAGHIRLRADRHREELVARCGDVRGREIEFIEMFEISEYARQPDADLIRLLFPEAL